MMVLRVWLVAAIVTASLASAQTPTKPATRHKKPASATSASNVVQPDRGTAPEQAVQPDASAPLAQSPNYDPPPPPPRAPDPDPPAPVAVAPAAVAPAPVAVKVEAPPPPPPPPPLRPMTPQEQQLEKDSTRLLTLVRELKEEIDKAGIDTLSLSALRKAEEIQRLSRDLKERLKLQPQATLTKTQ